MNIYIFKSDAALAVLRHLPGWRWTAGTRDRDEATHSQPSRRKQPRSETTRGTGRAGERLASLGELADAGVAGFSDDGSPVQGAALFRNALAYAGMLGLPVIMIDRPGLPARRTAQNVGEIMRWLTQPACLGV